MVMISSGSDRMCYIRNYVGTLKILQSQTSIHRTLLSQIYGEDGKGNRYLPLLVFPRHSNLQ